MKILVINNLGAGYGDGAIYDFIRSFAEENDEICLRNTNGHENFGKYLMDASQFDMVVASGGDGTVSGISHILAGSGIPLLPFPAGCNNLIAHNLFTPIEPHALAKMAKEGLTMNIDLGLIKTQSKQLGFGGMAGAGFDTFITKGAKPAKRNLGVFAYLGAALSNFKPQISQFKLVMDDQTIETEGIGILLLNFSKIGMDLSVTHANRPRDGLLDIVVLKAKNALGFIPAMTAATLDKAVDFPDRTDALEFYRSSSVIIDADPAMEIQVDAEATDCFTPFKAEILPMAVKYVVCQEGYNAYHQVDQSVDGSVNNSESNSVDYLAEDNKNAK